MKELKNLEDLLKHEVQELYEAEKTQLMALPRMIKKSDNSELRQILDQHLKETEQQKQRLERVSKLLSIDPSADKNPSIIGLAAEGELVLHKDATPETRDAAVIAGIQKIEHYEISGYGTAVSLSEQLGMNEVCDLLRQTLSEEKEADSKLNKLAKSKVNIKAEKVAAK